MAELSYLQARTCFPVPGPGVLSAGQAEPAGWAAMELAACGSSVGIRSNDPTIVEELGYVFPPRDGLRPPSSSGSEEYQVLVGRGGSRASPVYRLAHNGRKVMATEDRATLLAYLERSITTSMAQRLGARYHLIHAAALASHGRGVLLPGASGSGKSTLAAALAVAGYDYYSDELAILSDQGCLLPFAKVVTLRADGWRQVAQAFPGSPGPWAPGGPGGLHYLSPEYWPAGQTALEGCPVHFVVFPRYRPDVATALKPISRSAALLRIVEQSSNLGHRQAAGMAALVQLVSQTRCYSLAVNELREAVHRVDSLVQGSPQISPFCC